MRWHIALALCLGLAPCALAADDKPAAKYEIPYRLTDTKHVLVRAKINGKGPFNLILDTGAPAVFVTKAVAKKSGVDLDDKGWGTFAAFEVEGGLKIEKVKTRVEDLVQIEGMNSMGLAGVELHGVIGYNVLAKFKIEYDFTADKLAFVELKGFEPPPPEKIEAKGTDDIQSMGPLVKMLAALSGIKPNFEIVPRGFVGIEFDDTKAGVVVKKVLPGSPAEKAGFKTGDIIEAVKATNVEAGKDLVKALAKAGVGTKHRITVKRGDKTEELSVELGKGL
ncbi:MAG: PDZ domain-containing protein [Planctomycetes bacterium]|nr:PDZ domain-containing protein [Planctomycetota bacterium]